MRGLLKTMLLGSARLATLAVPLLAGLAHAGDATRIQLVAEIPAVTLSVVDASGDVVGEVDGIATDALAGPNPGDVIVGAQLLLSFVGSAVPVTWGHLNGSGDFVTDLPGSEVDGTYEEPFPGAQYERLYTPPLEFDTTGPNNALDRSISLAVRVQQGPGCDVVLSKALDLVKPPLLLVHGINFGPTAWTTFAAEFETNRGYRTFAADHQGGSYSSGAPEYGGNGDIHDSYAFVRGGMPGTDGVSEALDYFRTGDPSRRSSSLWIVASGPRLMRSSWRSQLAQRPKRRLLRLRGTLLLRRMKALRWRQRLPNPAQRRALKELKRWSSRVSPRLKL